MPPPPVLLPVSGVMNGTNTVFYTPTGYAPGSLRVFRNGVLLRQDLDGGWVEDPPLRFYMKEAPKLGDVLAVYYYPG